MHGEPFVYPHGLHNSSSVFYVDPAVTEIAPHNQILKFLLGMQERRVVAPFPAEPCRNYNALYAGFDVGTGEHVSLWKGVESREIQ